MRNLRWVHPNDFEICETCIKSYCVKTTRVASRILHDVTGMKDALAEESNSLNHT